MREVSYKTWKMGICVEKHGGSFHRVDKLSWQDDGKATFCGWGQESADGDTYVVAILELPNGEVITRPADKIKFTHPVQLLEAAE